MQGHYQKLKKKWQGYNGYDQWMKKEFNNAHLALVATYHELVPAFEAVLKSVNYDIYRFYTEVERIGGFVKKERDDYLKSLQVKVAAETN